MGNVGSNNNSNGRRRHGGGGSRRENNQNHPTPPPQQPPPEITTNQIVFTAATPYPNMPPQPYNQYPTGVNYQPPPPLPMAAPLPPAQAWVGGRYPCAPMMHHPTPYTDHQKAVTIKNDVNLKKETLKIEPDEQHPGKLLVEFTFDATVSGSIIIYFFAKESEDCNMTPIDSFPPITIEFQQGLNQKFKQESGTGIDLSTFEESEITKVGETGVYPLAIKAEATPIEEHKSNNSQITLAVFEKDKGVYHVKVVKQMLWVNGMRYELQEIYGIGNSVDSAADFDGNDSGKECVICLSEPRDTTVLPCRHMCMCSGCAKLMRFQTTKCPICRQPVERLLEIKVSGGAED